MGSKPFARSENNGMYIWKLSGSGVLGILVRGGVLKER